MKSLAAVASKKAATASPTGKHSPTSTDIHPLRLRFSPPGLLIRKRGGGSLDYFITQNYPAHNA
jgi:hypothetical protein